jgi:hypothetical protein
VEGALAGKSVGETDVLRELHASRESVLSCEGKGNIHSRSGPPMLSDEVVSIQEAQSSVLNAIRLSSRVPILEDEVEDREPELQ